MEPTGFAQGTRHVFDYALSRGVDEAELLRRADLRGLSLRDPDARLPMRCYYNVIEAAAELTGDPHFGLSYIDGVTPDSIGAIGFLAMTSATLGESIGRILRYYRLLADGERIALELEGERATIRFNPWGPPRPAHAHVCEMYAFDFLVMSARMTAAPVPILAFDVRHCRRSDDGPYQRVFGRAPRFESGENLWSFPASVLARPMPGADAALARFFEGYVQRLDRALPSASQRSSLADSLRLAISERLCDGELSIGALARGQKQSARTLQRRLADEGTSVSALIESVRRERAFAYLAANLPIGEVSYLLGFSEPRAFHRAFRRWTGETPQAWRSSRTSPRATSASRS
jgi:AraC-like DNA-binding protein